MNLQRRYVLAALAGGIARPAFAQSGKYPDHPIKLVVAFSPGGPNDIMARMVAERLGANLGQTVIVENKPGAGGVIGSDMVAKSAADGYTLLFNSAPFVMAPAIQTRMPYDTLKDFAPLTKVAESPMLLMVPSNSKFASLKDLLDYAQKYPGRVNYGSGGVGSTPHLTTEWFAQLAKVKLMHVPYKGGSDSLKALAGGEIDILIDSVTSTGAMLQSGRIKALAISSPARSPKYPNVPTFDEAGLKGFQMTHWVGIVAPAKVPADVLNRLRIETVKAVHSTDVEKRLADIGAQPVGDNAAAFDQFLKAELARWKTVAKSANITEQ